MKPLELALKYMEITFSGDNIEQLAPLFANDFSFTGPFYQFDSAADYIQSLQAAPPQGFAYEIINSFENDNTVGLFYQFSKPGICTPMAQLFDIHDEKISKILLIFDSKIFV